MKRRLLNLVTALSLLLSVAVRTLWLRSYGWRDQIGVGEYRTAGWQRSL